MSAATLLSTIILAHIALDLSECRPVNPLEPTWLICAGVPCVRTPDGLICR